MGQKQDVLEQIAEDWLQLRGYFTVHDVPFRPDGSSPGHSSQTDSVHSDIDLIAVHPSPPRGKPKAYVVTCKSGSGKFNAKKLVDAIAHEKKWWGKLAWKHFRELCDEKWRNGFLRTVAAKIGARKSDGQPKPFTYLIVVGNAVEGATDVLNANFRQAIGNNPIEVKSFNQILDEVWQLVNADNARRANSDIGRLLQLVKQSGWTLERADHETDFADD